MADQFVYLARHVSIEKLRVHKRTKAAVFVYVKRFQIKDMKPDMSGQVVHFEAIERYPLRAGSVFDTWAEARAHLDAEASERVRAAREELNVALRIHETVFLLRES